MEPSPTVHVPVLLREVLEWLDPRPGKILVDGTLGGGGHTRALAERVGPDGLIVALDRDPAAIARAEQSLRGLPIKVANVNFTELSDVLDQLSIEHIDGVLLDLGLSSDQLADPERGFSFASDGPLDLRFDPDEGRPAWKLLEHLDEREIADLIFKYGEERYSRRIARAIVEARRERPIRTAAELADLVRRVVPRSRDAQRIDPATRTFQALRIAVNDELRSLETALRNFLTRLAPAGRVAVISFHSLEDRIVKEAFRSIDAYEPLTKKPIGPSAAETEANPRARSAKMRVAQKKA